MKKLFFLLRRILIGDGWGRNGDEIFRRVLISSVC